MVSLYFYLYPLNSTSKEINDNAFGICIIWVKIIAIEFNITLDFNTKPQHITYILLEKMKIKTKQKNLFIYKYEY